MKVALACALVAMVVVFVALSAPLYRAAPFCIAPPSDVSPIHVTGRATDRLVLNH